MGASRYINLIGGVSLYDARSFARQGIELGFLKTGIEPRHSLHPYLSIIHTLMTESDPSIQKMLTEYEIIPAAENL
jgi:hypothetical protein